MNAEIHSPQGLHEPKGVVGLRETLGHWKPVAGHSEVVASDPKNSCSISR